MTRRWTWRKVYDGANKHDIFAEGDPEIEIRHVMKSGR